MKSLWFIAIVPPRKTIEKLDTFRQYAAQHFHSKHALKTVPHITLFPPFAYKSEALKDCEILLKEVFRLFKKPKIILEGFGAFKPGVIYIHVEKTQSLMALQAALAYLMIDQLRVVRKMEHRGFNPHLTIAHRDLKKELFPLAWRHFQNQEFSDEFVAEEVVLFQHDGHRWRHASQYSFSKEVYSPSK